MENKEPEIKKDGERERGKKKEKERDLYTKCKIKNILKKNR